MKCQTVKIHHKIKVITVSRVNYNLKSSNVIYNTYYLLPFINHSLHFCTAEKRVFIFLLDNPSLILL